MKKKAIRIKSMGYIPNYQGKGEGEKGTGEVIHLLQTLRVCVCGGGGGGEGEGGWV